MQVLFLQIHVVLKYKMLIFIWDLMFHSIIQIFFMICSLWFSQESYLKFIQSDFESKIQCWNKMLQSFQNHVLKVTNSL